MIQLISAATFNVRDMARSLEFYQKLGFELLYSGESATFSSLKAGEAFVNLSANPGYEYTSWGRVIFRVVDLDGLHRAFMTAGLKPESPRDAAWGERFFHIRDPEGSQLRKRRLSKRTHSIRSALCDLLICEYKRDPFGIQRRKRVFVQAECECRRRVRTSSWCHLDVFLSARVDFVIIGSRWH
jgi:catechol 2,3-dioxygenase-like lactoylglutathione lyase family enzyme